MRVEAWNGVPLRCVDIVELRREACGVAFHCNRTHARIVMAVGVSEIARPPPEPLLDGRVGFLHLTLDLRVRKRPQIGMARRMPLDPEPGRLDLRQLIPVPPMEWCGVRGLTRPAIVPANPSGDDENLCR